MRADPSSPKPPARKGGFYPEAEAFHRSLARPADRHPRGRWRHRADRRDDRRRDLDHRPLREAGAGARPDALGPVPGDFEIVSMGAGIAIFCFLAWAQFNRGHITVDVFVSRLPPRGKAALAADRATCC
jgi:hypothetical protein